MLLGDICSSQTGVGVDTFCPPAIWKNAGVIAGRLAAALELSEKPKPREASAAVELMFQFWSRFVHDDYVAVLEHVIADPPPTCFLTLT